MKKKFYVCSFPVLLSLLACPLRSAAEEHFRFIKDVPIPSPSPWTGFSVDDTSRRLYAASESTLLVADLDKDLVIRQTNIAKVHCFLPVPRYKVGFYAAGDKNFVDAINLNSFKGASGFKTSGRPQTIVTDPNGSLGFAFCSDRTVAFFEPDDGDLMSSAPLPGTPRFAVMDPKSHRVFCSVDNGNQVIAFTGAAKVGAVSTWSVAPGENPAALIFDPMTQQLLVGCGNNLLIVMDALTGKVVDNLPIDSGADAIVFDPASRHVFATGGKGKVSIVQLLPQKISVAATLDVPPGSHCLAVDPKTHKLYVGSGDGSKILVFGQ